VVRVSLYSCTVLKTCLVFSPSFPGFSEGDFRSVRPARPQLPRCVPFFLFFPLTCPFVTLFQLSFLVSLVLPHSFAFLFQTIAAGLFTGGVDISAHSWLPSFGQPDNFSWVSSLPDLPSPFPEHRRPLPFVSSSSYLSRSVVDLYPFSHGGVILRK